METLEGIGGELLTDSGFKNESVMTQDGTLLLNGQLVLPIRAGALPESDVCVPQRVQE